MDPVLLVFPLPTNEQMDSLSPPLSILYVGSYLEKAGVPVSYIDLRIHTMEDLYSELDKGPLLVGVSSMTGYQLIGTLEVLQAVRERASETPTVLGGIHASMLPDQSLADDLVDFVVVGEGEVTLLELVEVLEIGKEDFAKILGLGWKRKDGSRVINPPRPFMDLGESPPPVTETSKHLFEYYPMGKVQVSRGCPHRCSFCYNTVFNRRKYRFKPLENIEAEILAIKRLAPTSQHLSLLSDHIGHNRQRIIDIADLVAKHGYTFHTSIRAEVLDEELVSAIDGICEEVFVGVEHVVPRIRKLIRKDNTVSDIRRMVHILAKSSIRPVLSFMTAFPGETLEETLANMDFADELQSIDPKAEITPFFLTTPFPGTELFQTALECGFKGPKRLKDWSEFGLGHVTMPWVDKATEIFTDLYGISLLIYTKEMSYQSNDFERQWFSYLREKALQRWHARDLRFKKELAMFVAYNEQFRRFQRPRKRPRLDRLTD